VTHAANPLDECRLGLEEVERMMTISGDRHGEGASAVESRAGLV
jgi:hypothetical protein